MSKFAQGPGFVLVSRGIRVGCRVLGNVKFEFEFDMQEAILPYYLDLLNFREVSNEIANRYSVQHQSPQILVLKNREVVYDVSHEGIAVSELKKRV